MRNRLGQHVPRQLLAACLLIACSESTGPRVAPQPPSSARDRILFIGNSLTEGNDLPNMVRALAEAAGHGVVVEASLYPGSNLQDQWELTNARARVADGHFDVVILQQGPSALPESRVDLIEWTTRWAPVIRAAGGVPALYAPWPSEQRSFDFARVSESYRLAAAEVDGIFLPAGDAWLRTWELDPSVPLYAEDRFHPSVVGTYAAAVVIVARLFAVDPLSLPHRFTIASLGAVEIEWSVANNIQLGAKAALAGANGAIPNERGVR